MEIFVEKLNLILDQLQTAAVKFFKGVFGSVLDFWNMPETATGASILTGAFAIVLILCARFQLGLSSEAMEMTKVLAMMFFVLLFVCGIMMVMDPSLANGQENYTKLVALACTGVSLGSGLIALDGVLRWGGPVLDLAHRFEVAEPGSYRVLAVLAACFATFLLFLNTVAQARSAGRVLAVGRLSMWAFNCFVLVALGLCLIVAPPF